MQITKELLDSEIAGLIIRVKDTEASVNKLTGALVVLQDLRKYLDQEEEQPRGDISPENAEIQAREEMRQAKEAMSMQEFAELVAGPGATADEPQPIYNYPPFED